MASVGTLEEGWRRRRRRPRPCWGEADAASETDARSRARAAAAAFLPIAAPARRDGGWRSTEAGGWGAISSSDGGGGSDRGCQSEERQHARGRGGEQARPPRRRLSSLLLSLPLLLALGLLLPGARAFNILPHVPSFRHHLFFHPATPAPSEGGPRGPPTSNHLSPTGGDSGSASGEEHPLHAGAGTLVDVARRRFWRWTVWRRLYHSSVVTVLKQAAPPALPSFAPRRPRLESTYTKATPFQFNEPDAGPVAVASTAGYNSVHLVTRAAAPEQKSLIYVNGTEVSGHLRSAVSILSPPPFPSAADDATTPVAGQSLSLSLLGEFCIDKPAYLHIAPTRAGSTPLLWVTQFSLTRKGSVSGISIFGGPQPRSSTKPPPLPSHAAVPPAPAPPSSRSPSPPPPPPPVEMRLGSSFRWPNEVYNLPPGAVAGAAEEALLVADGFLMPGRSDGGLYVVQDPGKPSERVTALTRHRPGWFYHKAVWVDVMGEGGRPCLLTARATKPFFAQTEGELVLLLQPEGPFPLAEWNTPWREVVLAKGPDVMFEVADLDPEDETLEVFAAEFFSRRLTLHRVRKGDHRTGRLPRVLTSEVLDDTLGPAYSVVLADLKGDGNGRPSHVLVSSHECQYEGLAGAEDLTAAGRGGFGAGAGGETSLPGLAAAAALSGVEERPRGPGLQGSSSSSSSSAAASTAAAAALDPELKGGSLFAYAIPKDWRKRVPWKRSVVATGFHVRTWGQINPGAPGFPYVFYPHAAMQGQKGQRPYILLAGDCSHAAYIYRPVPPAVGGKEEDEEDGEVRYEPMAQINCGGTVGSLAVGYLPLFGQESGGGGDGDDSRGGAAGAGGWAKVFVPNFDTDKVYAFSFGPSTSTERGMHRAALGAVGGAPAEGGGWQARLAEEDEAVAALDSYGRARGEKPKIS